MSTYYRTGKGGHRHLSWHCANVRRAIRTGEPVALTDEEVKDWPACEHCCPAGEVAAASEAAAAKLAELCPNPGVTHPGRYQSTCRACGKVGRPSGTTSKLRAHKPAR